MFPSGHNRNGPTILYLCPVGKSCTIHFKLILEKNYQNSVKLFLYVEVLHSKCYSSNLHSIIKKNAVEVQALFRQQNVVLYYHILLDCWIIITGVTCNILMKQILTSLLSTLMSSIMKLQHFFFFRAFFFQCSDAEVSCGKKRGKHLKSVTLLKYNKSKCP